MRQPVGYPHFDLAPELVLLHQLWTLDALFTNYLLAQQESIEKHRHYVRVTKCHGRAQTPHERALSHLEISEITRTTLKATFATIHLAVPQQPDPDSHESIGAHLVHQKSCSHPAGPKDPQPATSPGVIR